MQFTPSKTIGDITLNDASCIITKVLGTEIVKKAAFIVLSAGLLTVIVIQSGTIYTPVVDVFVYCAVYCAWITMCLPWLVQNLNGKLLGLIIGVIFRLFAVDVGVLAWSAFRGQRNIIQRGLRMRPLFEPSMSWLAEAGYNLRYGVVISAIVASAISLLIDFYEKISNERKKTSRQRRSKNNILMPNPCAGDTIEDQSWDDECHEEARGTKFGSTVRFNFGDGGYGNRMSNTGQMVNDKQEYKTTDQFTISDYINKEDNCDNEEQRQEYFMSCREGQPSTCSTSRAGWKNIDNTRGFHKDNIVNATDLQEYTCAQEGGGIGVVNSDRVSGADVEDRTPTYPRQSNRKPRGKRVWSAVPSIEISRCRPTSVHVQEGSARNGPFKDKAGENDKMKIGRRGTAKETMENALSESLHGLTKLKSNVLDNINW